MKAMFLLAVSACVYPELSPVRSGSESLNRLHSVSRHRVSTAFKALGNRKNCLSIDACISPMAPVARAETLVNLRALLKDVKSIGREQCRLRILDTAVDTEPAREAYREWGIQPLVVQAGVPGVRSPGYLFCHVVFTAGDRKVGVILSGCGSGCLAEAKIVDAIEEIAGSQPGRLRIGIPIRERDRIEKRSSWAAQVLTGNVGNHQVIEFDAESVDARNACDVLFLFQASEHSSEAIARLADAIADGLPAVVTEDPWFRMGPWRGSNWVRTPLQPLWSRLGASISSSQIIGEDEDPIASLYGVAGLNFAVNGTDDKKGTASGLLHNEHSVTKGLRRVAYSDPGRITPAKKSSITVTPLLRSRSQFQLLNVDSRLTNAEPLHSPSRNCGQPVSTPGGAIIAAHLTSSNDSCSKLQVVLFADSDIFAPGLVMHGTSPTSTMDIGNASLMLNAIEVVTGRTESALLRSRRVEINDRSAIELAEFKRQVAANTHASDASTNGTFPSPNVPATSPARTSHRRFENLKLRAIGFDDQNRPLRSSQLRLLDSLEWATTR